MITLAIHCSTDEYAVVDVKVQGGKLEQAVASALRSEQIATAMEADDHEPSLKRKRVDGCEFKIKPSKLLHVF
jgi:hypothetical protein